MCPGPEGRHVSLSITPDTALPADLMLSPQAGAIPRLAHFAAQGCAVVETHSSIAILHLQFRDSTVLNEKVQRAFTD
jgi:hypothetical protein